MKRAQLIGISIALVAGILAFVMMRGIVNKPQKVAGGVQVAAAEGSTKKADLKLGGALFGSGGGAALGGYGNTNEGKIIAAAFMDNYNKMQVLNQNAEHSN